MSRTRAQRRQFRQNHIRRKKSKVLHQSGESWYPDAEDGRYDKGKIHCSCWMCAQKTNRDGFKHSDQKKMQKGE